MARFLWICLGGAVGTGARYLLSEGAWRIFGAGFPYGTLAVNVIGSFFVALLTVVAAETTLLSPALTLALTTGVMGGFTTYSAFSHETLLAFQEGAWGIALLNVVVTVLGCLGACVLGQVCARWWVGA